MLTGLMLVLGLVVLTVGAEVLVRGASRLAVAARISPLVIGLTVVAFGTSMPELVVSVQASLKGQAEIALGNVVGSNIFNVLFILGVSAVIIPLRVSQQLVRFDVPLMIGLSLLMAAMAWDGQIGAWDGTLLVAGLIGYTTWGILQSRKEQAAVQAEYAGEFMPNAETTVRGAKPLLWNVVLLVVGLGLLVLGSNWLTEAALTIARQLGVSELVIGLTVIAASTSLPEVATSVMAAFRGERDIAVGNVVGSNIFNLLGVLGLSGIVSMQGVVVPATALQIDIPVMIAAAVVCLPIFFTGHRIARWEGVLFLGYFCAYTVYLILAATEPAVSRTFGTVVLGMVLPLTVITLAVTVWQSVRRGSQTID